MDSDVTDEELARWAENEMTLNPASITALLGEAAAARGRAAP